MKKYYNVEIAYNTREMINRVDDFRMWLYDNNIKHEISSVGDFVHFEILLSKKGLKRLITHSMLLYGLMVLLINNKEVKQWIDTTSGTQ